MDTFFVLCGWTDGWIGKILFKNILYFNSPSVDLSYCPSLHYTQHTQDPWPLLFWNIFFIFFVVSRWTLSKTIFMFSFRRFSYSSSQEFWRVCMSHALGCLYITVSVCVYAFEWRSVQCVRCVFWLYMYVYDFSKNVPLFLAKKSCIFFSLGAIKLFILLIFFLLSL